MMFHKNTPTDRGLVRTILLIVVALLILSYFGFNLRSIANSPTSKDNFSYVWSVVTDVWNNYLKKPATYLWKEVFLRLIWSPTVGNLDNIQDTEPRIDTWAVATSSTSTLPSR